MFEKNCDSFPNSYWLALSMNRAIKYFVAANKLGDGVVVGCRRLPKTVKTDLESAFAAVVRDSNEWRSLLTVILKQEKPKKNEKRNLSLLTATAAVAQPVELPEEDVADKNRLVDRVALLACARPQLEFVKLSLTAILMNPSD